MILTTHAVFGATVAAWLPEQPALGLAAAFASHFLLDAVPHWDYSLPALKEDERDPLNTDFELNRDGLASLARITLDFALGLLLVTLFFPAAWLLIAAALVATLPDLLQFVYFKTRSNFLRSLQIFHHRIHTKHKLKNRPILGPALQIFLILACLVPFF